MSVLIAPLMDGLMRCREVLVRTEVSRGRHAARRQRRAVDSIVAGKWRRNLRADFDRSICIEIQSDVASGLWQLRERANDHTSPQAA